ncbi:MAG: hypothetical protein ABFS09_07970 [Thermodesulfobacteriota bacterium]
MHQPKGNSVLFWKTIGIIAVLAAAIGVAASYWVGHRIQESLMEIANAQELQSQKEQTKMAMLDEQVRLLQARRLEAFAAVQVGLYSPGKRQQVGFR